VIKLDITMRHAKLRSDFEEFVREKVARLEKYLRGDPRAEIILDHDHELFQCEVIVHGSSKGVPLVAHVSHEDPRACVDLVIEKVGRQLVKLKDRRIARHRGRGAETFTEPGEEPEGGDEPSYEDIVQREIKGE
jgi:ribosomal subunit interface protein